MDNNFVNLLKSPLFNGMCREELEKLYTCLAAREKVIEKDAFVLRVGDEVRFVYILLSGRIHIIDEDLWGNRSIIETMEPYTLFGEAYALSGAENHLVSVIAAENAKILEIDPIHLFETCSNGCKCHTKLIQNTACILSQKIVRLTEKLGHIAQRTIREKVLSYLSMCARQAQNNAFDIPYSRQQLADYLCVDRSALSHELSKLREQGLLRYHKNHFELNML